MQGKVKRGKGENAEKNKDREEIVPKREKEESIEAAIGARDDNR